MEIGHGPVRKPLRSLGNVQGVTGARVAGRCGLREVFPPRPDLLKIASQRVWSRIYVGEVNELWALGGTSRSTPA